LGSGAEIDRMLAAPMPVGRSCDMTAWTAGLFEMPTDEATAIGCRTPAVLTGGIMTMEGRCGSPTLGDPIT
jgi:hypothetical protein